MERRIRKKRGAEWRREIEERREEREGERQERGGGEEERKGWERGREDRVGERRRGWGEGEERGERKMSKNKEGNRDGKGRLFSQVLSDLASGLLGTGLVCI